MQTSESRGRVEEGALTEERVLTGANRLVSGPPAGTQNVVPWATTVNLTVPQSPWSTEGPRLSLIPSQLFTNSKCRSGDRQVALAVPKTEGRAWRRRWDGLVWEMEWHEREAAGTQERLVEGKNVLLELEEQLGNEWQ